MRKEKVADREKREQVLDPLLPRVLELDQKFDFVDGLCTHLSSAVMVASASWSRLASTEGAESTEEDGGGCEFASVDDDGSDAAGATSACWKVDSNELKKDRISCVNGNCDARSVNCLRCGSGKCKLENERRTATSRTKKTRTRTKRRGPLPSSETYDWSLPSAPKYLARLTRDMMMSFETT